MRQVAADIYTATGGYVAGALALATAAGIGTYIVLSILGVPFAVPLAVLMAFFDLIPLVGSTIGGVLVGVVTVFGDFPGDTIIWGRSAWAGSQRYPLSKPRCKDEGEQAESADMRPFAIGH